MCGGTEEIASHGDEDERAGYAALLQNAYQLVWRAQGRQQEMAVEAFAGLEISNGLESLYGED